MEILSPLEHIKVFITDLTLSLCYNTIIFFVKTLQELTNFLLLKNGYSTKSNQRTEI